MSLHRSRERSPGERGFALGRAHRDAVANTLAVYLRMFAEDIGLERDEVLARGERIGERVGAVRPDLVEELAGMSAGAGQPHALLLALNARTELLAGGEVATGGGECSVAGVVSTPRGRCLLAQNWDFHPDLARSRLLWTVELADGTWFTTFTEAGMVAKLGLNDAGLAVALNFLASDADSGSDGVPIHVLLRMLLDGCRDPSVARELIARTPVSASACITVASSANGCALTAYEISPLGSAEVSPRDGGLLAHTNHFVAGAEIRDLIAAGSGGRGSLTRLDQVEVDLRALDREDELEGLRALLSTRRAASEDECVYRREVRTDAWLDRRATLATVAYDLRSRRMWIRTEDDPDAPLQPVDLP